MKTTNGVVSLVFSSLFLFSSLNVVYAGECFPQGTILISGANGQTYHGVVSPMGTISISDPNSGTLQGHVDSMGYFKASNDYVTVNGTVDTSCPETSSHSVYASMCTFPPASGCTQESSYQSMLSSAYLYGTNNDSYTKQKLSECREQIDTYQLGISKYNQCERDYYGYDPVTKVWGSTKAQRDLKTNQELCPSRHGVQSYYNQSTSQCECNRGYTFDSNSQCDVSSKVLKDITECTSQLGQYSKLDTNKSCVCQDGYKQYNGTCSTFEQVNCYQNSGENSYPTSNGNCACKSGYHFDKVNKTKCIYGVKPSLFITPEIKKFVDFGNSCFRNQKLSQTELQLCSEYESNKDYYNIVVTDTLSTTKKTDVTSSQESTPCPLNASSNDNYLTCTCNKGFTAIFKDESKDGIYIALKNHTFVCGTWTETMQDQGIKMYGSEVHYNASTTNFECNDGYIFENLTNDKNNKCVPIKGWCDKNKGSQFCDNVSTIPTLTTTQQIPVSQAFNINKTNSSSFTRTLKKGMSGGDVKQLQILLQKLNYLSSTQVPSTYFGSVTSRALARFQKDNKIQSELGSFGPTTQAKLISLIK